MSANLKPRITAEIMDVQAEIRAHERRIAGLDESVARPQLSAWLGRHGIDWLRSRKILAAAPVDFDPDSLSSSSPKPAALPAAAAPSTAADEKARLRSIIESPEAVGRSAAATHLAFETDLPARVVISTLAQMPKAPPPKSALQRAMEANGSPNLSSDVGGFESAGKESPWAATVAKFAAESAATDKRASATPGNHTA